MENSVQNIKADNQIVNNEAPAVAVEHVLVVNPTIVEFQTFIDSKLLETKEEIALKFFGSDDIVQEIEQTHVSTKRTARKIS